MLKAYNTGLITRKIHSSCIFIYLLRSISRFRVPLTNLKEKKSGRGNSGISKKSDLTNTETTLMWAHSVRDFSSANSLRCIELGIMLLKIPFQI